MVVIDLTGLANKPAKDEPEKLYCKYCIESVELLYCNQDSNDKSSIGMPYKKGDYQCPRCGNVRVSTQKKKEQKGSKLSSRQSTTPQGYIGIEVLSTHPNYGMPNKREPEPIDTLADEALKSQGVEIHSETFYPASNKVIKR